VLKKDSQHTRIAAKEDRCGIMQITLFKTNHANQEREKEAEK